MQELVQKHCVPCEGGTPALEREGAEKFLAKIPQGWVLSDDAKAIAKDFRFKTFREAQAFINRVADTAEAEAHHPNISWRYNKVKLTHTTHAIGGLSENDFILAAKVEAVIGAMPR